MTDCRCKAFAHRLERHLEDPPVPDSQSRTSLSILLDSANCYFSPLANNEYFLRAAMGPKNSASAYEEVRKQRLEENKKRMEELNLVALCNSFSEARNSAHKTTPQRNAKPRTPKLERGPVSVRRSSRVANIPAPDYREAPIDIPYVRRSYGRRSLFSVRCANPEERQEAVETAAKIESELGTAHPTFLKPMLQSHVSGGFWLGLPTQFCSMHMPKRNEWMILEDENGEDSRTLFLSGKTGLSAGWRGFSIEHQLEDGDCLVFQQVQPTRFKVYIVRASGFASAVASEERANNTENLQNEADNPPEELQNEADDSDRELQEHEASNLGKRKRPLKAGKKASKTTPKTGDGKLSKKSGKVKTTVNEKETSSEAKDGKSALKTKGQSSKPNKKTDAGENAESGSDRKLTKMLPTRKATRIQNHIKTSGAPSPIVMVQA